MQRFNIEGLEKHTLEVCLEIMEDTPQTESVIIQKVTESYGFPEDFKKEKKDAYVGIALLNLVKQNKLIDNDGVDSPTNKAYGVAKREKEGY